MSKEYEKNENSCIVQITQEQDLNSTKKWEQTDFIRISKSSLKDNSTHKHRFNNSAPNINNERKNIEKGEKMQEESINILKKLGYINIEDVSKLGRGYDIECVEKATNTRFYIEVKTFDSDFFEMTENEYKIWSTNKDIYKILLMDSNNKLYDIIDGIKLKDKFNIQSSKYKLILKDY